MGLWSSKEPDNKLALASCKVTHDAIFQHSAFSFKKTLNETPSLIGKNEFPNQWAFLSAPGN